MSSSTDLTTVQSKLHDAGAIWSRTELLRLYNDGYRTLIAQSGTVSRFLPLDVPGRFSYAVSYPFETRHTSQGTWWFPLLSCYGGNRQATAQWEAEHLDGVTVTMALVGLTQQWERAHTTATDRHYSFGLPSDHERVRRIEWNNRVLRPASVREFDELDDAWMRQTGDPSWWTVGTGQIRSVEIYEITTEYIQAYQLIDATRGIPREITGDRDYSVTAFGAQNAFAYSSQGDGHALSQSPTVLRAGLGYRFTSDPANKALGFSVFGWEIQQLDGDTITALTAPTYVGMYTWESVFTSVSIDFALGSIRGISSEDRQYLPMISDSTAIPLIGGIRDWRSSADNVMVLEQVVPSLDITETESPALLPTPINKYLRYYVLSRAFGRDGEGFNQDMSEHYDQRFKRGVRFMTRLNDVAYADRTYRRQDQVTPRDRPPLVRLPPQFERQF